jgi:hypothetical protein
LTFPPYSLPQLINATFSSSPTNSGQIDPRRNKKVTQYSPTSSSPLANLNGTYPYYHRNHPIHRSGRRRKPTGVVGFEDGNHKVKNRTDHTNVCRRSKMGLESAELPDVVLRLLCDWICHQALDDINLALDYISLAGVKALRVTCKFLNVFGRSVDWELMVGMSPEKPRNRDLRPSAKYYLRNL